MPHAFKTDLVVSLASGIFIGGALFGVFPESSGKIGMTAAALWLAGGLVGWWIAKVSLQKLKKPAMPILTAITIWIHSVLEGVVTGLAFGVSQIFGVFVFVAITLHVLPEFFAATVLMKGTGSTTKGSIATSLAGFGLLYASFAATYLLLPDFGAVLPAALAVSGGAFIFIGLASFWKRKSFWNFVSLLVGALAVFLQTNLQ